MSSSGRLVWSLVHTRVMRQQRPHCSSTSWHCVALPTLEGQPRVLASLQRVWLCRAKARARARGLVWAPKGVSRSLSPRLNKSLPMPRISFLWSGRGLPRRTGVSVVWGTLNMIQSGALCILMMRLTRDLLGCKWTQKTRISDR